MLLEPQTWSCLPMAFATALEMPFSKLIKAIGHDGGAFVYKNSNFRRGFHIQECIDVALSLGAACTPIEHHYALTPDGLETYVLGTPLEQSERFLKHLDYADRGVLEGMSLGKDHSPLGHTCAWVNNKIHDPKGPVYSYNDRLFHNFSISRLWRIIWI